MAIQPNRRLSLSKVRSEDVSDFNKLDGAPDTIRTCDLCLRRAKVDYISSSYRTINQGVMIAGYRCVSLIVAVICAKTVPTLGAPTSDPAMHGDAEGSDIRSSCGRALIGDYDPYPGC